MVEFLNIYIEGDYIYADEHDMMTDTWSKIKLHVSKEEYHSSSQMTGNMIKALWCLQHTLLRRKPRKVETIYWG